MPSKRRQERESASKPEVSGAEGSEVAPSPNALWAITWHAEDGVRMLSTVDEVRAAHERPGCQMWIDLVEPDRDLLQELGTILGLHHLVTEDILERNQRAKIEVTGDVVHIVMFALRYEGEIVSDEIDIVLGNRYLLTSHDADVNPREAPFTRRDPEAHLPGGVDYVLWGLADWLVDDYFPVFDRLGEEIDQLEDDVMQRPNAWVVERLFQVRRDLLTIRHSVNPQREIFNQLTNRDMRLIKPERIVYFRDVYDHLIRLTDELDSYRELVATALDMYLSQVNNNLSDVMKRLTAVTAILAGAGALAGLFGMSEAGLAISFEDLRFWVVTAAIVMVSAVGFIYARRIGWI